MSSMSCGHPDGSWVGRVLLRDHVVMNRSDSHYRLATRKVARKPVLATLKD